MKENFQLTITGTQNGEWQGTVRTPAGCEATFRSLLELIGIVEQILPKETA